MGTIVHKALQLLGDQKLCTTRGNKSFTDDELGRFNVQDCNDLAKITKKAFDYYQKHFPEVDLTKTDLKTCTKWTEKAVEYQD